STPTRYTLSLHDALPILEEDSQLGGSLAQGRIVVGGKKDDLDQGIRLLDSPGSLQPIDARHVDIHEHDVRVECLGQLHAILSSRSEEHTSELQSPDQPVF